MSDITSAILTEVYNVTQGAPDTPLLDALVAEHEAGVQGDWDAFCAAHAEVERLVKEASDELPDV